MATETKKMPVYSVGEERFSAITHIVGGGLGVVILVLSTIFCAMYHPNFAAIFSVIIYGLSMITLYTMSALYHFLPKDTKAKRVFRIFDHCTIYFLIAGTYTPICVIGLGDSIWALVLMLIVWGSAAIGITATAINMYAKPVKVLGMILYVIMGWSIIICVDPLIKDIGLTAFIWLLAGGLAYTIGIVFYATGKKKKWIHSIWHLFCIAGSLLQFISIFFYIIL